MTRLADLLSRLTLTAGHARVDGKPVASLRYSGRVITVKLPSGKAAGRLMPCGYAQGAPDDGSGLVDAWTALHPSVPVPSDTVLGQGLTPVQAVALLLSRVA